MYRREINVTEKIQAKLRVGVTLHQLGNVAVGEAFRKGIILQLKCYHIYMIRRNK